MVNQETIAKMKDGIIIVNTVWGSVIENELDLYYDDYKYAVIGNRELSILRDMPNVLLTLI